MGRPPSRVWQHFDRLGKPDGRQHWAVVCKHCRAVHGNEAEVFSGRLANLESHLSRCGYYKAFERQQQNGVDVQIPATPSAETPAGAGVSAPPAQPIRYASSAVHEDASVAPSPSSSSTPVIPKTAPVGRPPHPVWNHYERLGRREGRQYYYVACKYCGFGRTTFPGYRRPFEGRVREMCAHLETCAMLKDLSEAEREDLRKSLAPKRAFEDGTSSLLDLATSAVDDSRSKPIAAIQHAVSIKRARIDPLAAQIELHQFEDREIEMREPQDNENDSDQMTQQEIASLHDKLIDMMAANRLPLWWVEHPSTVRMFHALRPAAARALPTQDGLITLIAKRKALLQG